MAITSANELLTIIAKMAYMKQAMSRIAPPLTHGGRLKSCTILVLLRLLNLILTGGKMARLE